jgi:hypothetical protein
MMNTLFSRLDAYFNIVWRADLVHLVVIFFLKHTYVLKKSKNHSKSTYTCSKYPCKVSVELHCTLSYKKDKFLALYTLRFLPDICLLYSLKYKIFFFEISTLYSECLYVCEYFQIS